MSSIYLRKKIWHGNVYRHGKLVWQGSLKTTEKLVAKDRLREQEAKIFHRIPAQSVGGRIPAKDVLESFTLSSSNTAKKNTIANYRCYVGPFLNWSGNPLISAIDDDLVSRYLNKRFSEDKISKHTAKNTVKIIKSFMNFAVSRGHIQNNPIKIKPPRVPRKVPPFLTRTEIKKLLAVAKNEPIYNFIRINLYLGLRPDELKRLKWKDINFDRNIITVQEAKDNEFRHVPLSKKLKKILKSIPENDEFVIERTPNLRRIIKRVKKRAGITHVERFQYLLRHTFATHYYMQTRDLEGLRNILGHSTLEQTTIYVHPDKEYYGKQIDVLKY